MKYTIEFEKQLVSQLGRLIGFGNLMTLAEREWRKLLEETGHPLGSEFAVGVCRLSLENRGFKSCLELMKAYDELKEKQELLKVLHNELKEITDVP